MRPNPILPVFHVIEPGHPWPDTVDPIVLSNSTAHFAQCALALATTAADTATPLGATTPATHRAEVLYMRWAATAGYEARLIMRAAKLRTGGPGEPLLHALTSVLMLRTAERAVGARQERHDKCMLNQALAVADWVGVTGRRTPGFDAAAQIFTECMPAGWRWENKPPRGDANAEDQTFTAIQDRATTGIERDIERVTVTGCDGTVRITYQRADTTSPMTWAELCAHMARCAATAGRRLR